MLKQSKHLIFCLGLLNLSCAEEAPIFQSKEIHVYSDFLNESNGPIFQAFERKKRCTVVIHESSLEEIEALMEQKKWNCKIDMVFLSSTSFLDKLNKAKHLYFPKEHLKIWEPLSCDPYVLLYDTLSSTEIVTSYGRIYKDSTFYIDTHFIESDLLFLPFKQGMKELYSRFEKERLTAKITLPTPKNPKYKLATIHKLALRSQFYRNPSVRMVFPDQNYKGAIAKTNGAAVVKYAFNMELSIALKEFCHQKNWKKLLARTIKEIPYYEVLNQNEPLIYPVNQQ
jgi:hypothetical protein